MNRVRNVTLVFLVAIALAAAAGATTVVHQGRHGRTVVHRGPRGAVVVHRGFPIRRTLPHVWVRAPRVAVRVAPRVFLPHFFSPAVVVRVRPLPAAIVWHEAEIFEPDDEWTEVTYPVTQSGTHLYFELTDAPARVSFAEVVYGDGETQVVDFGEKEYAVGYYGLIDLPRPRAIDHVRLVAAAGGDAVHVSFHLAL